MAQDCRDRGHAGVAIHLPRALWQRIAHHLEGTAFPSVDDFVIYAVRETLARAEVHPTAGLSPEEEQQVKERLRALGYLE